MIEQRAQRPRSGRPLAALRRQQRRERQRRVACDRGVSLALEHREQREHGCGATAHRGRHLVHERAALLGRELGDQPVVDVAERARGLWIAAHAEVERELERDRLEFLAAHARERRRVRERRDQRLQVVGGQRAPVASGAFHALGNLTPTKRRRAERRLLDTLCGRDRTR